MNDRVSASPRELLSHGGPKGKPRIDFRDLEDRASAAIRGSDASLAAAREIQEGNFLRRLWDGAELNRHVIDTIGHVKSMSEVNLALSALCHQLSDRTLRLASEAESQHRIVEARLIAANLRLEAIRSVIRGRRDGGDAEGAGERGGEAGDGEDAVVRLLERSGRHDDALASLTADVEAQRAAAEQLGTQLEAAIEALRSKVVGVSGLLADEVASLQAKLGLETARSDATLQRVNQRIDVIDAQRKQGAQEVDLRLRELGEELRRELGELQKRQQRLRQLQQDFASGLAAAVARIGEEAAARSELSKTVDSRFERERSVVAGILRQTAARARRELLIVAAVLVGINFAAIAWVALSAGAFQW